MSTTPKQQRRLNRSQIQEILERNIALYKEEEHAAAYLVELALYLLEYEYDWADSPARAPLSAQEPMPSSASPGASLQKSINGNSRLGESAGGSGNGSIEFKGAALSMGAQNAGGRTHAVMSRPEAPKIKTPPPTDCRFISPDLRVKTRLAPPSTRCPHCGTEAGEASICPSCKNLVR